jgi:molecular chaperone GrpE
MSEKKNHFDDNESDQEMQKNQKEKESDLNDSADRIKALEKEIASLKDTVLRKVADYENFRKRTEKDKFDAIRFSNTKFAKDLLSVIDNFERVTENSESIKEKIDADPGLKAFFDGIMLCEKELLSVLKKHGIEKIEIKEGDVFNPDCHQAISELVDPNHKPGSIVKVLQTGYNYNDRLLRPAMVSVSKK